MVNAATPDSFIPATAPHAFRPPAMSSAQVSAIRENANISVPNAPQNTKQLKMNVPKPALIGGLLLLLLLLGGIVIAASLSSKNQDVRQQAYVAPTTPTNPYAYPSPTPFDSPSPFPSPSPTDTTSSSGNPYSISNFAFASPTPTPSVSTFVFASPSPSPSPLLRQTAVATNSALMRTGNMTWTFVLLIGGAFSLIGGGVMLAFNNRFTS